MICLRLPLHSLGAHLLDGGEHPRSSAHRLHADQTATLRAAVTATDPCGAGSELPVPPRPAREPAGTLLALARIDGRLVFEHGEQGGTFNGSPLMTAVGCAVMETMLTPGFLPGVADAGAYLGKRLAALVRELGLSHERGLGLLRALDLGAAGAGAVVAYARDQLQRHPGWENAGLVLNAPRPDALRFMPALTVTRAEIDQMIEGARIAIQAVR